MEVKIVKQLTVKHFISFDASNAECHRFYQQAVGLLAICCTGPGTFATQIYFMFISIVAFLGAILLCLLHFKFFNFNRHGKCIVSANQLNHEYIITYAVVVLYSNLLHCFQGVCVYCHDGFFLLDRLGGPVLRPRALGAARLFAQMGSSNRSRGKIISSFPQMR